MKTRSPPRGTGVSGGEQAIVSIGRGPMRAPKLLLVDEPSLGLPELRDIKEVHEAYFG